MYDFNRLYEDCDFAPEDEVTIDNLKNLVSVLPETREKYLEVIDSDPTLSELDELSMSLGICRYLRYTNFKTFPVLGHVVYDIIEAFMKLANVTHQHGIYYSITPQSCYYNDESMIQSLKDRVELIDKLLLFLDKYKL